jgi:hypothetical protein
MTAPFEGQSFMSQNKPMTGATLQRWRKKRKLSERGACLVLGLSRGALRNFEAAGAPLYIALACAALDANLSPVGVRGKPKSRTLR